MTWVVTAVMGVAVTAVCWSPWVIRDTSDSGLSGRLRIGFADEAPYAYIDESGRVTGEGPETARAVAQRLGLGEPEWILTDFNLLIDQLRAGRFDVIAAGMFITPERSGLVAFSRPTLEVRPALLVAKDNPRELYSYADAVRFGHVRVAALAGSVEERGLLAAGLPVGRLVAVPDPLAGIALLKSGRVDGLALSEPTLRWLAAKPENRDEVEVVEHLGHTDGIAPGLVAFAFRAGDVRLRRAWDVRLADYLESGEHDALLEKMGLGGLRIGGEEGP